jgi:hypothetical protein
MDGSKEIVVHRDLFIQWLANICSQQLCGCDISDVVISVTRWTDLFFPGSPLGHTN